MEGQYEIKAARSDKDIDEARKLFAEYFDHLRIDYEFNEKENDIDNIRQTYISPDGALLILYNKKEAIGCGAIRRIDNESAELKRMYIKFEYQGLGLSKELLEKLIQRARDMGYKRILLDTLPAMSAAIRLYQQFGFTETDRFNENPVEDARFFKLELE
jgi:GNAT superfamily N-acetyltransferase